MDIITLVSNKNYFSSLNWSDYGSLHENEKNETVPDCIVDYLNKPCPFVPNCFVKETHFLFYLPSELDGIALTINSMRRLLNNQNLLRFNSPIGAWFSRYDFATISESGSWKLLFAGPIPGSIGLTNKKQKRLFRNEGYRVPLTRTVIAMLILKARKTSQILSDNIWGRTAESYDDGLRVRVGVFDSGAICLSGRWSGKGYPDTGIFAEKVF